MPVAAVAYSSSHTTSQEAAGMSCSLGDPQTCWMGYRHEACQVIDKNEHISLRALIAYVAQKTGRHEFSVDRELSNLFCVPNLMFLPKQYFEKAIHHLADQVPEMKLLEIE